MWTDFEFCRVAKDGKVHIEFFDVLASFTYRISLLWGFLCWNLHFQKCFNWDREFCDDGFRNSNNIYTILKKKSQDNRYILIDFFHNCIWLLYSNLETKLLFDR